MTINLKEIRVLDTDNIKLDKINYNFDQLIVNGGGPKGYMGPDGNTGPQGFQGVQGFQGDRGVQGVQGPNAGSAVSFWEVVPQNFVPPANIMATLFAKHVATPISAVVAAGYIGTLDPNTGDVGYYSQQLDNGLPKYQWVVNRRRNKVANNLRFTSEGVDNNAFDITMDNIKVVLGGVPPTSMRNLRLGFIDNQNSQLNFQAEQHIIDSAATGALLLKIYNSGGEINVNSSFEDPVTFNQKLSVKESGAGVNKVAAAMDTTGEVVFKTTAELGGSVKIGTIISILPSIFSDPSKFVFQQTIDTTSDPNNPLKIRMGAGIGDYAGWYVCNGQSWTDGTVPGTISVPDLNSYSYQIVANPVPTDPNSQGSIIVNNDEIHLIGGADIFVNANEIGTISALYNIGLTNNSNNPVIATNSSGSTQQFKIKKLPQIIYLGVDNLYWSRLGTGQISQRNYSSADYSVLDYNAF
jgi:hypothetical protein